MNLIRRNEEIQKRKKLDFKERLRIEEHHRSGLGPTAIARRLKRSPSTISREIKRNSSGQEYMAHIASQNARTRLSEARAVPRNMTQAFKKKLKALLKKGWGPEQISGRLKRQGLSIDVSTLFRTV